MTNNSPLVASLFQMLELAVVFGLVVGVAWVMKQMFNVNMGDQVQAVAVLVISGLAKFSRASDASPEPDFVNKQL